MSLCKVCPARATINLTADRARSIIRGADPAYRVIRDEIEDHSRWSVIHLVVIQSVADGRFWQDAYSVGATESQDESPWENGEPTFTEVFPTEQTVIVYK